MARYKSEVRDRQLTNTRKMLISAAIEEFSQYEFAEANMDRISRAANCAKGTVYNHFANKEELFLSVLAELGTIHSTILTEALVNEPDITRKVAAVFTAHGSYVKSNLAPALLLAKTVQGSNDKWKQHLQTFYAPMFQALQEDLLKPGIQKGFFHSLRLQSTGLLIMTILLATSSQVNDKGESYFSPEEVSDFIIRSLRKEGEAQ